MGEQVNVCELCRMAPDSTFIWVPVYGDDGEIVDEYEAAVCARCAEAERRLALNAEYE